MEDPMIVLSIVPATNAAKRFELPFGDTNGTKIKREEKG